MPYRRLPNTDIARINALEVVVEIKHTGFRDKDREQAPGVGLQARRRRDEPDDGADGQADGQRPRPGLAAIEDRRASCRERV